jgi:hypothetical protein
MRKIVPKPKNGNYLNANRSKTIKSNAKKSKQNKWKYGIIAKTKTNKLKLNKNNRNKYKKRSNLIEKGIITRSIARKLINKNILDENHNYVKESTPRILNDDVLKLIFQYLSLKDKFRIQRTSKQFCRVIQELLSEQHSIRIGNVADYYANCRDDKHSTNNANIEDAIVKKFFYKYFYMNDITGSKDRLEQIFWKCPNIRCIELHNFQIDVETVKWIKWHLPNIECLRIDEIKYDLTARKWSQIGQSLGDKLIHLHVDGHNIKNDLTNLVQHLPQLKEFNLRNYELPINLLLKRLSSNITSLSLIDCEKLNLDSIKLLTNNKLIAKNLLNLEINVSDNCNEVVNNEIFTLICNNFNRLEHFSFISYSCPSNLMQIINLKQLKSLEINFTRDCFLDLSQIQRYEMPALRSLKIHGSFFTPQMLELIGQQFSNIEKLSLTNWAFCCGCDNDNNYDDYDCPECDEKCCQSLLKLEKLETLYLEFLYSSDYIKPLILSLLSFRRLHTITHIWYPVNTSINSINFIDAIINYGISMANKNKNRLITFKFEKYVIALIDAAKKLPRNLVIKCID